MGSIDFYDSSLEWFFRAYCKCTISYIYKLRNVNRIFIFNAWDHLEVKNVEILHKIAPLDIFKYFKVAL